jgi:hypothetical protein
VAALIAIVGSGTAFARGGGRGGRGGRGGGSGGVGPPSGGGGSGRGGGSRGGGNNSARNNERMKEQERLRREERLARVADARIAYAKRERQASWDQESGGRFAEMLRRLLGGSSE